MWRCRLILLNIIIAILMDGYASVKATVTSTVEEHLKANVGPILPAMFRDFRRRLVCLARFWHPIANRRILDLPWSEDRWVRDLQLVTQRRARLGLGVSLRVGELISELRRLPTSQDENIAWQIQHTFQDRKFISPSNINQPFQEPDVDSEVKARRAAAPG